MNNLDERLRQAADRIVVPPYSIDDDIARGRRRTARRRIAGGAVAVATVTAVAGMINLPTGGEPSKGQTVADSGFAGQGGPSGPSITPKDPDPRVGLPPTEAEFLRSPEVKVARKLVRVVGDVLDPAGNHIDRKQPPGVQGGFVEPITSIGTKVGWTNPGQPGSGLVQIEVATTRKVTGWAFPTAWPEKDCDCEPLPTPDGGVAQLDRTLADDRGSWLVTYTRPDGLTVRVYVSDLFGNNTRTPAETGVTPKQVAALVADDRLAVFPIR
ncbi:MAG: hypothetical protein ACRCYQ_08525 [Nocardioides sp.]